MIQSTKSSLLRPFNKPKYTPKCKDCTHCKDRVFLNNYNRNLHNYGVCEVWTAFPQSPKLVDKYDTTCRFFENKRQEPRN